MLDSREIAVAALGLSQFVIAEYRTSKSAIHD
jgi:hypothetical protein